MGRLLTQVDNILYNLRLESNVVLLTWASILLLEWTKLYVNLSISLEEAQRKSIRSLIANMLYIVFLLVYHSLAMKVYC